MQIHMQWMHATCSDLVCMMTIRVQWEYFILFLILSVVLWNGYPRLMVFTVMTAMLVKIGSREIKNPDLKRFLHNIAKQFATRNSYTHQVCLFLCLSVTSNSSHFSDRSQYSLLDVTCFFFFFFYNLLSLHLQFFCLYYLHVVINELLYISRHPKHLYRSNNRQIIYRIITKI